MIGLAGVGLLLLTPAGPVPAPPRGPAVAPADRGQATQFAQVVFNTAYLVARRYDRAGEEPGDDAEKFYFDRTRHLFAGAIRGLYDEAGVPVPDQLIRATTGAASANELVNVLVDARVRLGNVPALSGARSLFAAVNGFRHGTDPHCGLVSPRVSSFVSVDKDFDIGIELDGVSGQRWNVYRVERGVAAGTLPATGTFGPVPKPDDVPSPATFPWRVKRVIPGSPAQKAGVKPGDVITHLNDTEITAETANRQFAQLAFPAAGFDPNTGRPLALKRRFQLRRAGAKEPIAVTLETQDYTPETVFGVVRTPEGKWDCLLDRGLKVGYVRLGPIEERADVRLGEMLDDLKAAGCRGLILDLRWCPGGYVTPGTHMAGMFLKPNDLIAEVKSSGAVRNPNNLTLPVPTAYLAPPAPTGGKFRGVPVLMLVGAETTGGGELIAAALQDNDDRDRPRFAVMGQRTAGRAVIQNAIDAGFGGLQFKVTTGTTLRPNGKPRGRLPDSKPTDDWGIRPDPGLEVPVTADLSAKLRQWADEHALRPAESNEALPFDDPQKDPYRAAALAYFRKRLGPTGAKD
jgi:C-terminal processing protease CtpA/Prc